MSNDYSGVGRLKLSNSMSLDAEFDLTRQQNGRIVLSCTFDLTPDFLRANQNNFGNASNREFQGKTMDDFALNCAQPFLEEHGTREGRGYAIFICSQLKLNAPTNKQPHHIRVPLVNLLLLPAQYEHVFPGNWKVPGQQLPLECNGTFVTIVARPDHSAIIKGLEENKGIEVTCDLYALASSSSDVQKIKEILCSLCSILTFTSGTRINWMGYDLCAQDGSIIERYFIHSSVRGYKPGARRRWSPVPWMGKEIQEHQKFYGEACKNYDKLWDDWDIYALINLFTETRGEISFVEVAGLQLSSCLEILKARYKNRINSQSMSLRDSVREICKEIGFSVQEDDLGRFIDNRNSLTHEGFFSIESSLPNSKSLSPRQRWGWHNEHGQERMNELQFMEDFVGTLIFHALGGKEPLCGF